MEDFLVIVASYLVGSLPFGLLLAKLVAGRDPRLSGSGNVGATNVARVLGKKWFPVVFLLDASKGVIAVLVIAPLAFNADVIALVGDRLTRLLSQVDFVSLPHPQNEFLAAWCGGAAVIGHVWSVFLGFKGGKGVATTAGALGALAPIPLAGSVTVFLLALGVSRMVSLASVFAAVSMPLLVWWFYELVRNDTRPDVLWFSGTFAFLIVLRHHSNLYRIITGTEPVVPPPVAPTEPEGDLRD